jgi:ferredoxin
VVSGVWRIEVDPGKCIGSGMCAGVAPGHFRVEGGVAVPLAASVVPDDAVVDAAESCPVEAISVHDADGHLVAPEP